MLHDGAPLSKVSIHAPARELVQPRLGTKSAGEIEIEILSFESTLSLILRAGEAGVSKDEGKGPQDEDFKLRHDRPERSLGQFKATEALGKGGDDILFRIGDGDAQPLLLTGAENGRGQGHHAALFGELPGDQRRRPVRERVADIGEIGAGSDA